MHHCSTQLFDALVTLLHARDLLDGLAAASERLSKDFDNCSIATHRRKAGDAIIVRYGTVDSYELMIVDFLVPLLPTTHIRGDMQKPPMSTAPQRRQLPFAVR